MHEYLVPHGATAIEHKLHTWRTNALNIVLNVTAIVAMPMVVLLIADAVYSPTRWPTVLIYLILYLLEVGLTFFRRLGFRLRAWGFLLLGYATGLLAFARGGLVGDGRTYLLALPVMALILVGGRAGLSMAILNLLTFATLALSANSKEAANWFIRQDNSLSLIDWGFGWVAFAMVLITLMALEWCFSQLQQEIADENLRLYEESERLRVFNESIVQSLGAGIFIEDATGYITLANPRIAVLLSCTPESLTGQHWKAIVAPEDMAKAKEEIAKRLQGVTSRYEVRLLTQEGERVPVIVSTHPLFEDGHFSGAISVLVDITERKRAEETLRASENRLRALIQNMPVMLNAFDGDWNIVVWNRECEHVTGYSTEEIVGNPKAEEMLYPDAACHERVVTRQSSDYRDLEREIACKDGSIKTTVWFNISRQFPISGWATWRIGFDITERKRMESALEKSEEMLRAILDATTESLILLDARGTILAMNKTAARRLGMPVDELVGLSSSDLTSLGILPPDLNEARTALSDEVIRSCKPAYFEDERAGKTFDTTFYPVPDADGEVERLVVFARDITARKQAEQQAIRAERLAAMGYMAAALAHETKNPLQIIRSNIELLLDFELEPIEHKKRLGITLEEIERLIGVTERVLDFAQPSKDTRHPVSIVQLVQKTLELMGKQFELAQIQVTTNFPADDSLYVFVSPDQIIQVLFNLIANAIEAMAPSGCLHITAHADGDSVVLSLVNEGPQLTAEQIDHIFDPFFTTKPQGTGLGLSISYRIIERHGGTINVKNLEGEQGVAFTITLPTSRFSQVSRR